MSQSYELHEYPILRLFIVLTREIRPGQRYWVGDSGTSLSSSSSSTFSSSVANTPNQPTSTTQKQHSDNGRANLKHEVHVARHEGYDLDHPTEFFEKYGVYVLTLLQVFKYGLTIAGVVVPPLAQLGVSDGVDAVQKGADNMFNDMGVRGDRTGSDQLSGLEALEGADLRQLSTILRNKDDARVFWVFGNLYRIVTSEGRVKWLRNVEELNDGKYDEHTGHASVKLASPITARQLYSVLAQAGFVNELDVALLWETTLQDLRDFKDAIQHPNVVHLKLTGGGSLGPFSGILNQARRSDPFIQLMATGKIRAHSLYDNEGFLERISKIPTYIHVRTLDLRQSRLSGKELRRLAGVIPASSLLSCRWSGQGDRNCSRGQQARHGSCTETDNQDSAVQYLSITTYHGMPWIMDFVQTALSRYGYLRSLDLLCEAYYFHKLLVFIWKAASSYPSLQRLHLHQDDDNQLTTTDLQNLEATTVKVGVISTVGPSDSWDGVNSLSQHFGSEIQGLDLDMCLSHIQIERLL
ncbi:hypothetical protein BGX23_012732 [Mortierella sp. AD031]|nr:hypothetical protein BGX23_012732 [Mortierella sp. AD031]